MHPYFSINDRELNTTLAELPAAIAENIQGEKQLFLDYMYLILESPEELHVLVDKSHALASDYAPDDLVLLTEYDVIVNKKGMRIRTVLLHDFLSMIHDARAAGVEPVISSAYRSYDLQSRLYDYYVSINGREEADRFSARPGTSQHQLGLTLDFGSVSEGYENTPDGKWLLKNAAEYGFSLSYPEGYEWLTGYMFEPWHYRYVGPLLAETEARFFDGIQQYMLEYLRANLEFFRKKVIE